MNRIEFDDDPGQIGDRTHRWLTRKNVLAGTFAKSPTDNEAGYFLLVLRPEIAEWLRERRVIYRLFKDRIKLPSVEYTGYFIEIEDDTTAVEFRLRWF